MYQEENMYTLNNWPPYENIQQLAQNYDEEPHNQQHHNNNNSKTLTQSNRRDQSSKIKLPKITTLPSAFVNPDIRRKLENLPTNESNYQEVTAAAAAAAVISEPAFIEQNDIILNSNESGKYFHSTVQFVTNEFGQNNCNTAHSNISIDIDSDHGLYATNDALNVITNGIVVSENTLSNEINTDNTIVIIPSSISQYQIPLMTTTTTTTNTINTATTSFIANLNELPDNIVNVPKTLPLGPPPPPPPPSPIDTRINSNGIGKKMYNVKKPDLIVHPLFYKTIEQYDLDMYFNVIPIENLTYNFNIKPILVTDKTSRELKNVTLRPFFKYPINSKTQSTNDKHQSGNHKNILNDMSCRSFNGAPVISFASAKPENTSFYFERNIPIYSIEESGPRYVIWTKTDPLTICATFVNRIDFEDIYQACERAKSWAREINYSKSIIVFDLDDTLINNNTGKPFKYSHRLLQYARNTYDLMVLYSHGSSLHVDNHLQLFTNDETTGIKFDLVLSNNTIDKRSTKNLLSLYNYFPNTRFWNATLVDDSLYNWSPEYEKFIVPSVKVTLKHALPFIHTLSF